MAYEKNMNYAGFWKRFAAAVIDYMIWATPLSMLQFFIFQSALMNPDDPGLIWLLYIVTILSPWIYHAAFESSSKQATPGKMAVGIKVTDLNGRRIGFGKATGRYFGKIVSMVIIGIGFIMIAFTEKKQGLHDKMAGCLVVNK